MIFLVGLKIQYHPMVKEQKTKVEGGAKPKGRRFQQSTQTWKATFKAPTSGLEYNVFDFGKQIHVAEFAKNCEVISIIVIVNYEHSDTKMSMAIKKMEKPKITVPEIPVDTASRVEIFIWENK